MFFCRTVEHTLDVDAVRSKYSRSQLRKWLALYLIEPWGEQRSDLNAAMLMSCWNYKPPGDNMPFLEHEDDDEMPQELMIEQARRAAEGGR